MSDGKVTISTALDNASLEKGLKGLPKAIGNNGKGLLKAIGGITAGITAAFGAAAVAVTKQSADAYADYEQLAGGVETLFKGAASKVKAYAEDAFYTAGVSANEYMETVTSISASLISSLGGDTEKAADIANMAMIDMADNANKMGTPIENVKTAYAGFAKQQYMLLDNLKLGYGGTKTEMQRLLKDAQAFSGIKYDINNLADVYSAIHVIQQKLGIAGATAEEAEKTITGSANMTKAAWKNVLAAISGGGNLDKAINNLVYSVSKYFENIVPVVERSLSGIGQLIERIAPMLVQTVATALIKAIPSLLNAVYQMIVGLAKGIYQGIAAIFSGGSVTQQITKQLDSVADGYASAAGGATQLEKATEEAGKAAKRSLAGFDELNKLQGGSENDTTSGTTAGTGSASAGAISGAGSIPDAISPQIQGIINRVLQYIKPLQEIDLSPAAASFSKLGKSVEGFGKTIGKHLEWAWFNILAPLATWVVEEAAPTSLGVLSSGFDLLSAALDPVLTGLESLWVYMQPLVAFVQESAITAVEGASQRFDDLAALYTEKGPQIEEIFSNMGVVFSEVWAILEPILTQQRDMWQAIADTVFDLGENKLTNLIDRLTGISQIMAGLASGDWSLVWQGMSTIYEGELSHIENQTKTLAERLGLDYDQISKSAEQTMQNVGKFFSDAWSSVTTAWETASTWFDKNVVQPVEETFAPIGEWFGSLFEGIGKTAEDIFGNIGVAAEGCWQVAEAAWETVSTWFDENVIQPVAGFFSKLWENAGNWAADAWTETQNAFDSVATFFEDVFSEAWQGVVDVFAPAGEIFEDIKDGIGSAFKKIVNDLITGINEVVRKPFEGINTAIGKIRDLEILGITPFSKLKTISVPKIPYLAQGAVLPPNKPFMAVVGDQRHGTNIEAPLATIQEAVAAVMQEYAVSNMAGHEATVAVLREILEAVLGISIGDDVIAGAVSRYNARMAVVRGGQV